MAEVTLNQNIAECLKHTADFGSTTVHNICNGASTVVPWGSADWALAWGLIGFAGIFGLFMLGFALSVLRDALGWY